tara:strand:- start:2429 stop:7123 length:4695 start_codon:yes stop_codon:yes gene_type:complete
MGKFGKGLNRDSNPIDQPEGTWRYAKNAVVKKELGGISNESGTSLSATGPTDYTFIGKIEISSDFVILFSVENITSLGSEIGIFKNGAYTTLLKLIPSGNPTKDLDLNFSMFSLISGTFKYNTSNELIIYWTDNNNPPRTLNVTQQQLSPTGLIYNKLITTNYNISYKSILDMFPNAGTSPVLDSGTIVSGGSVVTAAYNLVLAYKTEDGTSTNYVIISNIVYINDETLSGGLERIDGATSNAETGKAIKWVLSNYNNSYEYIQPTILKRTEETLEAFELPIIKLDDTSVSPPPISITYTAVESIIPIPSENVLIDKISYSTARDLDVLEDRLYAANLTSDLFPDYQPYANFIKTDSTVRTVTNFEALYLTDNTVNKGGSAPYHVTSSYKNLDKDVLPKGYKRGEVYAFYIAFVLNDGSMSNAFHIPGRDSVTDEASTYNSFTNSFGGEYSTQEYLNGSSLFNYEVSDYSTVANSRGMNFWNNKDSNYPDTNSWNVVNASNSTVYTPLIDQKVRHHRFPQNVGDYSFITDMNTTTGAVVTTSSSPYISLGPMQTLAMTDNPIEQVNDIVIPTSIVNLYGIAIGDTLLIGNFPVVLASSNSTGSTTVFGGWMAMPSINNSAYNPTIQPPQLQYAVVNSVSWLDPNFSSTTTASSVVSGVVPEIGILGFTLDDLKIPHNIATKIQGFEIFRAKRKHFDKTSLGQGLAMPMLRSTRSSKSFSANPVSVWSPIPLPWGGWQEGVQGSFKSAGNNLGLGQNYCQNGVSFHDFTLLREKLSIKQADYLQMQMKMYFTMYIGPYDDYTPGSSTAHQALVTGYGVQYNASNSINNHPFLIHKGAKTYVPGRSFYRVDGNFGVEVINNIGGNSKIALHLSTPLPLSTVTNLHRWVLNIYGVYMAPAYSGGYNASQLPNNKNIELEDPAYTSTGFTNTQALYLTDLKSFKRNVYIDFMERSLVSTGYRITGPELQRFLVDASGTQLGIHPDDATGLPVFTTDKIFGGDTFISRNTFRTTLDSGARQYNNRLVRSVSLKGLYTYLTESSDNIGMQHSEGIGTAFANTYFPKQLLWTWEKTCLSTLSNWDSGGVWAPINDDWYTICACLDLTAHKTATHPGDTSIGILAGDQEGIRYNNVYSMEDDIKSPRPKGFYEIDVSVFPTRIIRSIKGGTVYDSNRLFNALDFIDVNKSTGDINNILTLNNSLFIHTKNSLYKTIGKQKMETSSGSAFIGSGDIFAQVPETIIQTDLGYGGNQTLYSSVVSRYGYFWIDLKNKKVMSFTDKLEVISDIGMSAWFKDNLPDHNSKDWPYTQQGIHMEEDIINRRLLITRVNDNFHYPNENWTISYQLDYKQWVSFHDYTPNMYLYTDSFLHSVLAWNATIHKHENHIFNMCTFYGSPNTFEFEYVDQAQQESSKIYSNIFYNIEAREYVSAASIGAIKHNTGFTSFYVYNDQQCSGVVDINYLQNTRKNEGSWTISGFRDMAAELLDTTYSGTNNYLGANLPGTVSTANIAMFNYAGMNQNLNAPYIDMTKDWTRRGTFIDKYLNIHLISDNSDNLLLTLYFAGATKRLSYR